MTGSGWLEIAIFGAVLTALTPAIGAYMTRVFRGERIPVMSTVLAPLERTSYWLMRADPSIEQDWKAYARSAVIFSALSWGGLYLILRTQGIHPFNPEDFASAPWDVTFNTTSSFVANTNWQFYGGETTLSYFSQMAGLTVQNFVSGAVGIAVCMAVIRGFVARSGQSLGNFWSDLIRGLLYVLLPLSFVVALLFVSQGAIQNLAPYVSYGTVGGARAVEHLRLIAGELMMADVRAQVALSLHTDFENYSVFKPGDHQKDALGTVLDQTVAWSTALA